MAAIGLDFGTTNSVLAYWAGKDVQTFRFGGAQATDYVPSAISYDRTSGERTIGRAARQLRTDAGHEVYERFKLFLGEQGAERLHANGFVLRSPEEAAHAYLESLLAAYRAESGRAVDQLVVSVPEIWVGQGRHLARERLKEIVESLGPRSVTFVSEPVAASACFTWLHARSTGARFDGHVLVVDCGGGTIDLSLSRIEGDVVVVLENTGNGYDPTRPGRAGVAFDEEVLARVLGHPVDLHDRRHHALLADLEARKVSHRAQVDRRLEAWLKVPEAEIDRSVFKLEDGRPVLPSQLVAAFDTVIRPDLDRALGLMKVRMAARNLDIEDRDHLRIVLVGGFSGFYLVRRAVREHFGSALTADSRFHQVLSFEDTSLAIAKGAALVAAGAIEVAPMCPLDVSLQIHSCLPAPDPDDPPILGSSIVPFLRRGTRIRRPAEPVFHNLPVHVRGGPEQTLEVVISDGDRERRVDARIPLRDLLPAFARVGNRWRIGFSVDPDLLFRFHAVDAHQEERTTAVGKLLAEGS